MNADIQSVVDMWWSNKFKDWSMFEEVIGEMVKEDRYIDGQFVLDVMEESMTIVDWRNRIDFILTRTFDGFKHPSTKFAYVYFIATAKATEDRLDYYRKNSEEEE